MNSTSNCVSHDNEIENLKLLILKLRRMQFGPSSERLARHIDQLELRLEDLETNRAEPADVPGSGIAAGSGEACAPAVAGSSCRVKPKRSNPKRMRVRIVAAALDRLGEDVAETLEYVPARFKVIRTVRPKLSCTRCDRIVQQPAPHRPIERGLAGPGLLAHVLVAKYSDHLPLYRQSEIYEREGVELDRSTLADWVGGASRTLEPLVDALRRYVLDATKAARR